MNILADIFFDSLRPAKVITIPLYVLAAGLIAAERAATILTP